MRLSVLAILLVGVCLLAHVEAASKDRKKNNRARGRDESSSQALTEEDDKGMKAGGGFSGNEDRKKETKDRAMSLAEKQQERRDEKKEESSEEDDKDKDDKDKKENSTEIVIPRFKRQLTKATELNDGKQTALEKKPTQDHKCDGNCPHHQQHRVRRHVQVRARRHDHELKKAKEINDGEKKELENAPSQTTQDRVRRHGTKHGHHKASHPHGSGSNKNYNPYESDSNTGYNPYNNNGRKPRQVESSSSEEKEKTEEKHRKTTSFTGHHGKLNPDESASPVPSASTDVTDQQVLSEEPVNKRVKKEVEAHPRSSEERAPKQDRDATLVSADAAEIMEINP